MREAAERRLPELSTAEKLMLLRAARQVLEAHLEGVALAGDQTWPPALLQPFATFVTLRHARSGELRGCRGEVRARQPLIESVTEMVVASAVGDPRFESVRQAELEELSIDISVLGPMRPIRPQDVEVGRHGLMIVHGARSGLLLPSVPEACGWDRRQYLAGLCAKAGLPGSAWRDADVELLAFETVAWGESDSRA